MKKIWFTGLLYASMIALSYADDNTSTSSFKTAPIKSPLITVQPGQQPTQNIPAHLDCSFKIASDVKTINQDLVLKWAENAVIQAFSFKADAVDNQLKSLQPCFTDQGWIGFNNALQKSGNIDAIKTQKLTLKSQMDGLSLITPVKDTQWKLTLPLLVEYQNDKENISQLLSVDVTVMRKMTGDLGISQMVAVPRGSVTTKNNPAPGTTNTTTNESK